MIWPFKHKPSPTLRVSPESAYHPTELLDSVAGDDGAVAFGPGDDVRVMAQSDSIAGTWAVADSKHRALPIDGQKGSVFLHDGLVGQVRAVGDKTVMVKFPDPIGLVHVKRDDLWNSKPAMARPRWATRQALSLRVAQAIAVPEGLPQLLVDWVDFARKIWSKSPKVQSTATRPRVGYYTVTSGAAPTMVVRIPGNAFEWPYKIETPRSIEVRIYHQNSKDPEAPRQNGNLAHVLISGSKDVEVFISIHKQFRLDIAEHEVQHMVQSLLLRRVQNRGDLGRPGEPDAGLLKRKDGLTDPREIYPYLSQQVAALTQLAKKNGLNTVSLTPHEVEQFLLSDTHGRYRAYKEAHPELWPRVLARFMRELVRAGHTPAGMGTDSLTIPITERYKRVAMPMPTEADLPASWYVKQTTGVTDDDEPEIMWRLYDPEYRYNGQFVPVAALTIVERRPSVWAVSSSFCGIPGGWGAFLYEKALKYVTDRKGWLGSDITVSNSARNVWTKYMDRNDVEKRNRPKEMFPIDSKDSPAVRMMYRFKQKAYLREEDNDGQSAIVAIRVPELLAKDWPDGRGGHDSSPPHVSVVYLGDMRHIPDARDIVSRIVFETVNALPQFEVELEKNVSFFNKDNGDHVAIKKFDATSAENLTQLHDLVKRNLVAAGIPLGEVFEYTPHATLAYQYEPVWPPEMTSPQGSWTVDAVEVWGFDGPDLVFPLRGGAARTAQVMRTAGGMLTLYHYAPDDFEGGVLDPSRFGAGTYTSRDVRASDVPRVFFYLNPGDREQWFTGRRLFSAQVPASSIFDVDNGDPKVLDASRTSSGRIDPHELFLNVKGAGYKGIKYDAGGMPLVAYFEPIAVEPVQQEKAAQQQQFGTQPPPLGQSPQPFPQAQQQAQQQPQAQQKPTDTGQSSVGLQPLTDPSQKVNNPLMDVGLDSGGQVRVAPPGSGLVTQQVGTINNPGQQLSLKMPATTPAAQQVTDALSGADVGDYQVLIDNAQSGMDVQQLAKSSAKGKKSNKAYLDHDINPVTGELEWVLRSPHGVDVRWFGHMKPTPETVEAARRGGIVDRVFESEAETDTDLVGKDEMAQVLFGPMDYESPDDREVAAIEFAHADITPDSQKLLRSKDAWPQRTTYHNDSKVTRQTLDHHDLVSGGVGYSNIMAVMSEATPQEIESYGAWYGLGHDQALMISEESGVPLDRVCAVIALLSPGMKWENNLQAARRMCLGEPLAGSGGAFPMNVLKALRVLRGSSIEKTIEASEKVRPFYETLLSPEKSAEKAVVDRHMFAIWFGDPSVKMVDDPSVRALIQRDVQLAAREWNMPVQAIQAVTWAIWRQRTNIPRPDDELHPNDLDAPPSDYDYDLMKQGEFQASKRLAMPGSFSMDAFDLFGDDGVEAVTEVAPLVIGDQFKLDGKGPVFEVLNAKSGGDQWILVRPSTHKRLAYGGKFNRSTAIVTIYDKAMATIAEGKMTPVTQQGRTAQSAAASIAAWVEGDNSDQRVADFNWNFEQFDIHRLSEMTPAEWKAWFAEEVRVAEDNRLSSLTDGSLITSPIVLTEIDGDITLWDGFHRVGAAFTYGWNTLPAVVGRPHNQSVNVLTAEPVASERNTTRIAMPMPTDADLPKDWKLIQGESGEHYIVLRDSKDQAIANVNFIESTPGHWQVTHSRTRIPGWGNIPRPDDEPHPNEPDAPPSDYDYDLMKQGELQLTAGRYEDVLARYPDRKGLVDFFVNNDPTNWNGPHAANVYLAWMMEQALKNPNGGTADVQSIVETVNWFHRRKEALKPTPQNAHPRDINSWKSVDDLHAALTALGKSRSQKKVEGSKIVGQADGWTFYRVLDQDAACLLAKGTTWCIGADKNNMYDYYEGLGDTYIAIKGNEKWAIHTKRGTMQAERVTSPRNTEPSYGEWGSMWPAAEKVGFSVPMIEFTLDGYSWPDDRRPTWRVYIDNPDEFSDQVWELTADADAPFYLDMVHAEFRVPNMGDVSAISVFLGLCTDSGVKYVGVPGQRRSGICVDLTGPVSELWALATKAAVNRELQNDTVKDDDNAEVLHTASRRIAMPGVSRDDVVNHFNSINPLKSTGYDPWSRTYEGLEWSGPVEFAVDDDRLEDGGVTGYMNMPKERAVVEQYAERIRAGEKMPALIIVEGSRGDLGVADGGHRLEAARLAGLETVPAYIGLKPNTRISLTAERLPSKSQLWAMLTESLPERAVSKDMAIHDGAYARWQQPYAKYRSTRPVFTGGELDALNDALDLKGDARVSGPREAFDRLTRNARTWDDIARVVKLFNAVPGFESMHIPEHVMLQNLDEQERDWYEQEEAAAQDDKPLSDEERAQLPDDAFDFDPESLSHAASMRTAVRAGDLGIKDLRRWTASNGTWAMLSASQQGSLHQRKLQHRKLLRQLQELGVKPSMIVPVRGRWYENGQERAEQSLWVKGLDFDQAVKLGRQFDQDAVIFKSDDGVVGMYDLRNGRVRVPAQSGDPVFGDEAIDVAQRGPKVPMPGKGYVPSPEDLYTRGRSTSMSVRYDWDDAKSEFVHDLERPLSRADVERLYRKREGAVRTAMPMPTQLPSNWSEQSQQVGRSRLFVVTDAQSKLVAEVKIRPVDDSSRDFYVCWAQAKQDGWGAYCYERALEWVSDQGGTLRSDSLVSDEAAKVWNKYYDRLSDGDIEAQHVWPRDIIRYDPEDNDIARAYRTEPALNYAYRKNKKLAMPQVPAEFAQRLRMTLTPDLLKPEWRKKHEQACDPMTGHCYAAAEAAYHALGGAEAGWKPMHIKHEDAPHWYLQHADGTIFDPTASQFQEPPDYAQGRGKGFLTKAPSARARKILERMQSKIAMPMPRQLPAGWRLKAPPTLAGDYYIMTPENIPAAWLRLVKPRYSPTEAYVARVENNYADTVPGLGAFLYQHVMEKATREGVWLRSDTQVSDKARGVWKKFHDREDVVKEPRDNLPGDPGSIWKFDPKNLDADEDAGTWEPETAPELFHKYKLKIS